MNQLITIHPEIQSGTPVFFNTRVPIKGLFDYLKGGHTVAEFIADFPSVTHEQVMALLDFIQSNFMFSPPAHVQTAA